MGEEGTIKTSTAIVGGAAGFLFGGPIFALIGALGTNYYTSKNDNEATEALKGIGRLAINFYNLALSANAKYDLVDKAKDAGATAVDKVKEKDDKGIDGAADLNEQYALTDKAIEAVKNTANKAADK